MAGTIKKESEVTNTKTLADGDSIRVTLANGQSASIKKTDLIPSIKDAIGQWLGNSDALSVFTNILVNNGGVLGKATIENLASVVSGIIPYQNINGFYAKANSWVYFDASQYSSFIIVCQGYAHNSDILDNRYSISVNTKNYKKQVFGHIDDFLYISDSGTSFAIYISSGTQLYIGYSRFIKVVKQDIPRDGYTKINFI